MLLIFFTIVCIIFIFYYINYENYKSQDLSVSYNTVADSLKYKNMDKLLNNTSNISSNINKQQLSDNHTIDYFDEKNEEFLYDKNSNSKKEMVTISKARYLSTTDL